jgi:hypothetical protein
MAQFTVYRSSDTSAPVLTGEVGKLVALLDAVLVNGYGSKAAAGWTKEYSSTNAADYRAPSGLRHYLQVNDNQPVTVKEASVWGFEAMTAWDTGTNQFPATGSALTIRKSFSADTTAREWVMFADARTFYLFITTGDSGSFRIGYGFGEIYSIKSSADSYNTILMAKETSNSALVAGMSEGIGRASNLGTAAGNNNTMARNHNGATTILRAGKRHTLPIIPGGTDELGLASAGSDLTYPNGADGGLYMSPIWVHEGATARVIRGRLRGLWTMAHLPTSFSDGDTFSGTGDLAGKTFMIVNNLKTGSTPINWACAVETSNTLETN